MSSMRRVGGRDNLVYFLRKEGVEGDYLEFGVYRGASFVEAIKSTTQMGLSNMRYFAFDSFQGLPECNDGQYTTGEFACPVEEFQMVLRHASVDLSRVTMVKGWYDKTLTEQTMGVLATEHGLSKAAWVYMDCDLYESTKLALNFVIPLVNDGTVITFNDWWTYKGRDDKGERRACSEWLSAHPEIKLHQFMLDGYGDVAFVVQRD